MAQYNALQNELCQDSHVVFFPPSNYLAGPCSKEVQRAPFLDTIGAGNLGKTSLFSICLNGEKICAGEIRIVNVPR